jgi:hypothetical protein
MKISEIIKDKYKLRIPPTVYYDLLADVQEVEEKQEPMVEIDLYSVIKQKYIEREVLDKIRAEIKALSPEPTAYDVVDGNPIKDAVWETLYDVLKIIDKYRESEVSE